MARFRDVHLYPYSGWYRQPWGMPDTISRDVDAAARTARRVTEAISRELTAATLTSGVNSYRIFTQTGSGSALELRIHWSPGDPFLATLAIPRGLRFLDPRGRGTVIADAVEAALIGLAQKERWDPGIVRSAVESVRNRAFDCDWVGPWKSSRDRKLMIRLEGRILDDGYGRWRLVTADRRSGAVLVESDEVLGWTWLSNFDRAAKSMRWIDERTVKIRSGSDMLPDVVQVDVLAGRVRKHGRDPRPSSYPGRPTRAPSRPELVLL